jgi:hypothetical protein
MGGPAPENVRLRIDTEWRVLILMTADIASAIFCVECTDRYCVVTNQSMCGNAACNECVITWLMQGAAEGATKVSLWLQGLRNHYNMHAK